MNYQTLSGLLGQRLDHWSYSALRAEAVYPSPARPPSQRVYGLWHGHGGVGVLCRAIDPSGRDDVPNPCVSCVEKPYLASCPVEEAVEAKYDVAKCTAHVVADASHDCLQSCLARCTCTVGREYRYAPQQADFPMPAFTYSYHRASETALG